MINYLKYILSILSVFIVSGCLPIPFLSEFAPRIEGRVIDKNTGDFIPDAYIKYIVRTSPFIDDLNDYYEQSSKTDDEGFYSVGPFTQWHYILYIGSPGRYPNPYYVYHAMVVIEKDSYKKFEKVLDLNDAPTQAQLTELWNSLSEEERTNITDSEKDTFLYVKWYEKLNQNRFDFFNNTVFFLEKE